MSCIVLSPCKLPLSSVHDSSTGRCGSQRGSKARVVMFWVVLCRLLALFCCPATSNFPPSLGVYIRMDECTFCVNIISLRQLKMYAQYSHEDAIWVWDDMPLSLPASSSCAID